MAYPAPAPIDHLHGDASTTPHPTLISDLICMLRIESAIERRVSELASDRSVGHPLYRAYVEYKLTQKAHAPDGMLRSTAATRNGRRASLIWEAIPYLYAADSIEAREALSLAKRLANC